MTIAIDRQTGIVSRLISDLWTPLRTTEEKIQILSNKMGGGVKVELGPKSNPEDLDLTPEKEKELKLAIMEYSFLVSLF